MSNTNWPVTVLRKIRKRQSIATKAGGGHLASRQDSPCHQCAENPLPATPFCWHKVSEHSETHNPALTILACTTRISGFFRPVFPDLMKPHITEFHVCGRVAESPQHVAFRQQLPSHHLLEAEAPLAGGDESRLDADRLASTVSPRSRPARNRSSPTGTWALPRWCSTRHMTWRKRC